MTATKPEGERPQERTGPESRGSAPEQTADLIDAELVAQLSVLIEASENVDWRSVPGVSPETAATFTRRLIEARCDVLGGA